VELFKRIPATIYLAVVAVIISLVIDLANAVVDPRIRH
jgi:ABC-type dipeptide/oligopeptide/nickel transport system permease component